MRTGFINQLMTIAEQDASVNLIVGDLGYSVVNDFQSLYPDRFLNAGIAEQNMTGLAAGLALASERTVFTYSIANFSTIRCLEQIRNDVCYHRANVKIIAVGGGVAYGAHGYTHFAVEDVALMRSLPNLTVAVPADPVEAARIVELACANPGPWYIRLGKNGEPVVNESIPENFKIGDSLQLRSGNSGTILVNGPLVKVALDVAEYLSKLDYHLRVVSMPFVKPLSTEVVKSALDESGWLMTIEEHNGLGGFGSAVAEVVAEIPTVKPFIRCHLPELIEVSGSQEYLRGQFGLTCDGIVSKIAEIDPAIQGRLNQVKAR